MTMQFRQFAKSRTRLLGASVSALATMIALATPAVAQQAAQAAPAAGTGGIEQIVVTAQKRTENIQNVPIAISAFTANALKERGVNDVSQLTAFAPNVTLDASTPFSGSSAVLGASIRGVGSADFAFNIDPAVGVYLDGVFLGRSIGANQDLLDVDRIEVLKGPQGTLFGRNSTGGAINIVTHEPGNTFRFIGDVTTGSYNRLQTRMTMDVPLAQGLSAAISFGSLNREGYQHRIAYPGAYTADAYTGFSAAGYNAGDDRQGGDANWNGRIKLKYVQGSFKAVLTLDYTHINQESTPNSLLGTFSSGPNVTNSFGGLVANDLGPNEGFPVQTALQIIPGGGGTNFLGLYNFCIGASPSDIAARALQSICGPRTGVNGYNTLPGLAGQAANGYVAYGNQFITGHPDTTYSQGENYSRVKQYGIGLNLETRIGSATLKSITSYRQVDLNAGLDDSGSPLNMLTLSFTVDQHQWSQEFQLSGKTLADKLTYVFGLYGFNETGNLHDFVNFDAGLLQVDGPGRINTVALAGYGQIDYKASDLLSFTLGGRITHEHKNYYGGQADDNGFGYKLFNCAPSPLCAALTGFPVGNNNAAYFANQYGSNLGALANYFDYYPNNPLSALYTNFTPKAGVQLHASRDVMAYFTWSRGYKSGGWTTRLSNPLAVAPEFGPEKVQSFELGVKSTLLDRKLQLNADVFDSQYNGIQLNEQVGLSPTVENLGKAQIKGAEIEATVAPGGGFTLAGSLSYLDAHYTYVCGEANVFQDFCGGQSAYIAPNSISAGIYSGAQLPKAPHWKTNLSPSYHLLLPNDKGQIVFAADWTFTTSMRNDSPGTYLMWRTATNIVNGSIAYKAPGGNWDLTVGATNLTNQRYLITGQSNLAAGIVSGTYNRPAEWYARLGVKF